MNRNIVISIDDNYVEVAIVMLNSLLKHSEETLSINLYILNDGLNILSRYTLKKLFGSVFKIHFIKVNNSDFNKFHLSNHVSLATYYRLIVSDLLPLNVSRVLYLDCDLLISKDISHLYELEIGNFELAAAPDYLSKYPKHFKNLMSFGNHTYFNAGVLILNLDKMRKNKSACQLMKIASEYGSQLKYWDQDVLNMYYHSNYKLLAKQYNYLPSYFNNTSSAPNHDSFNILHFTGAAKPWTKYCQHPLNYLWAKNSPESLTYKIFRGLTAIQRKYHNGTNKLQNLFTSAFK